MDVFAFPSERCIYGLLHIGTYLQVLILTIALVAPGIALEKQPSPQITTADPLRGQLGFQLLEAPKNPPLPEVLERIAWCESRGRQFDKNGKPLRGVNYYDVGRYQINTLIWGEEAKKKGYDLFTLEGNEAMALDLYRRYGTDPWKWSRNCWDN